MWRGRAVTVVVQCCVKHALAAGPTVREASGAPRDCLGRRKRSWQEHRMAYEACQRPSERGVCSDS